LPITGRHGTREKPVASSSNGEPSARERDRAAVNAVHGLAVDDWTVRESRRHTRRGSWDRRLRPLGSHPETAIPAHLNPPAQRRELDRSRLRQRDAKEHVPRLGMQEIVLLHRPAMRTVIGEAAVLGTHPELESRAAVAEENDCGFLSEGESGVRGLTVKLGGRRTIHRSNSVGVVRQTIGNSILQDNWRR
jgi:hypothetical protein